MKSNIFFFYSYRIISRMYFHLPVLFLHLFLSGMGILLTETLLMVYGLSIMLNTKTNSFLLNYMPQKSVIALGELLKAIGLFLIIWGTRVGNTNFWLPFLGQIIGGSGFSLAISSDSSLLRSITSKSSTDLFNNIQSKSQSLMFLSTLLAGVIGSILFDYEAHWPFYISMLANAMAIISILLISEEPNLSKQKTSSSKTHNSIQKPKITAEQGFWMNYYALSRAFLLASFVGFLPFFFLMLQVDIPFFGLVLSLFSIGAFFSALYSSQLMKVIGINNFIIITMGCTLISMILFSIFEDFGISLIAILLLGFGSGCIRPLTMKNLDLSNLNPQQRASILSTMEQRFSIINAVLLLVGGYILIEYNFQSLMIQITIAYVIAILIGFTSSTMTSRS
ncbi:MFS transporter [Anabaena subtropica]|uniref:MFS transporter n=1 Tax=Anabaena subtropica FACHB-260 TaxID=2692884 RepID=A0ABR8CHN7_9NOST|nr:MFS transporter [Anabaena subtropica]MBD2342712.1 MFS transporter [Anabaena subtropica FACHB-260]